MAAVHARHPLTESYVTAAEADAAQAVALASALGRRARVLVRGRCEPGGDAATEAARAIEEALLFAGLLSRASDTDPGLRAEVNAILAEVRRDPSRKVVPIYLDESLLTAELQQAAGDTSIERGAVEEGVKAGRYLLLVDSLDEVPSLEGREHVVTCLARFAALGRPCRLVLTTRPTAHTGVELDDRHLRWIRIAPLDDETVDRMAERWSAAMGEDELYRSELRAALANLSARHPEQGDSRLVANPLLLTCAMLVYDQQRLLPDSAAVLFEEMVTILCKAKQTPGLPSDAKREALERVFTSIQEAGGASRPAREVAEALLGFRADVRTVDDALELLDRLAADTGLLRFETNSVPLLDPHIHGRSHQDE